MIPTREESKDSNLWSMAFTLVYTLILLAGLLYVHAFKVDLLQGLGTLEVVVLSLAVFRLTRLFVYDSIMYWVRDLFFVRKLEWNPETKLYKVHRRLAHSGFRRKMGELLQCPWCIGVWVAPFVLFAFYLHPVLWWLLLVLTISAVGSLIQLLANTIGWYAEDKKLDLRERA